MSEQKLVSLLGLAQRAGKLVSGDYAVEGALKSGKAHLLLIATDASENTKKALYALATRNDKLIVKECLTKVELGRSIGKHHRAAVAVVDVGFSNAITKVLSDA